MEDSLEDRLDKLELEAGKLRMEISKREKRRVDMAESRRRMQIWREDRTNGTQYRIEEVVYQQFKNRIVRLEDNHVSVLFGVLAPIDRFGDVALKDRQDVALELIKRKGKAPDWHFLSQVRLEWLPRGEKYFIHANFKSLPPEFKMIREGDLDVA